MDSIHSDSCVKDRKKWWDWFTSQEKWIADISIRQFSPKTYLLYQLFMHFNRIYWTLKGSKKKKKKTLTRLIVVAILKYKTKLENEWIHSSGFHVKSFHKQQRKNICIPWEIQKFLENFKNSQSTSGISTELQKLPQNFNNSLKFMNDWTLKTNEHFSR